MVKMFRCSSGHRFPVNLEKHQYRDYVMCPRRGCGVRVQLRKRKLSFNPLWQKIKKETRMDRLEAKEKKRKQPKLAPRQVLASQVGMSQTLATYLAFSSAKRKAEEKRKEEEAQKDE